MAKERKINDRLDLTKDEAVIEYIDLQEYLKSEDWAFPVIEKIERRMSALEKLVMSLAIKDREDGRNS